MHPATEERRRSLKPGLQRLSTGRFIWGLACAVTLTGCADRGAERTSPDVAEFTLSSQYIAPTEFSSISGLRELRDGRVLVGDPVEQTIRILDAGTRISPRLGRQGEGPGEFRGEPGPLFPLPNDTTVVTDLEGPAILFMHGDRFLDRTATLPGLQLIGVDTLGGGHWLVAKRSLRSQAAEPGGGNRLVFAVSILRLSRDLRTVDSIASIRGAELLTAGALRTDMPEESAIGFEDGWVAIAHFDPYRVDWFDPHGEWVRGSAMSEDTLPFERTAYPTLVKAPDGRLLIRRSGRNAAGESGTVRHDVVDRSGRLNGYFHLPQNEHVVGSGTQLIYIATEGPLGIIQIKTVQWPRPEEGH